MDKYIYFVCEEEHLRNYVNIDSLVPFGKWI